MIIHIKKTALKSDISLLRDYLNNHNISFNEIKHLTEILLVVEDQNNQSLPDRVGSFACVSHISMVQQPYKLAAKKTLNQQTIIQVGDVQIGANNFVVMAGPCSVENEAQLEITAQTLVKAGIKIMRGGVFKPRTSPYSFQGLGLEGLKLFSKVAKKYGLLIVSELTDSKYLNDFIKYVDIIQVGARNMANYELLKVLGQINKPILLKRSPSATYEELLMSAEYILAGGNSQVILCERGIKTFENYTRNTLDIQAVLALKELTHLPVIIDPSHAAGRFTMVSPLTLASLAVGAQGAIIEIHPDPANALSDGAQSIKLERFVTLIDELKTLSKVLNTHIT